MRNYCQECVPSGNQPEMKGFLERHDLCPNSELTVIGDIHGNDLRLDLSLKSLQIRGFLDGNFKCLPGKYIVFLGDFVDRGQNSLKVLELVITIKLENKDQVFLLRGNHEDLETSHGKLHHYAANDSKYLKYITEYKNIVSIRAFYESLPVGLYL
jgi:predicted MPP superfamily phosphohydrolase